MTNEELDKKIEKIKSDLKEIEYINNKLDEVVNVKTKNKEEN